MEENNEPIKIKLSTAILAFIILILIIAIVGIVYYYQNKISSNNNEGNSIDNKIVESNVNTSPNENSNSNVEKIDNVSEEKTNELDIKSELVQKLYKYILKENSNIDEYAYQSKKITVNELDETTKLCTVLDNLENSEADDVKTVQGVAGELKQYIFKVNTVKNKAKEIFGVDTSLKYKSIDNLVTMTDYTYENGEYTKCAIQQGGGYFPAHTLEYIIKAEKKNDELYIYDKYCYLCDFENGNYNVYEGSDKKVEIAKKISGNLLYSDYTIQVYDRDETLNRKIIEKIENLTGKQVPTYKHTFKKDSNGNYYWYSTEPI